MTGLLENYRSLAAAILAQAVKDFGSEKHRGDVADFLAGRNRNNGPPEIFYLLCLFLGLDPAAVKEKLYAKGAT